MAALAEPSYVTLQGVPCLIDEVPNHLSHPSGCFPGDNPESWDNGEPRWVPYHEGLPIYIGGLSVFCGGGPPYDPG